MQQLKASSSFSRNLFKLCADIRSFASQRYPVSQYRENRKWGNGRLLRSLKQDMGGAC